MSENTKKSLSAFMLKDTVPNKEVKLARYAEPFVFRPLRTSDAKIARNKHTKKGQEMDAMAFGTELLIMTAVTPDFHDTELQDFYGVQSAEKLIDAMLTLPEFQTLSEAINEDFNSINEDVEAAKN